MSGIPGTSPSRSPPITSGIGYGTFSQLETALSPAAATNSAARTIWRSPIAVLSRERLPMYQAVGAKMMRIRCLLALTLSVLAATPAVASAAGLEVTGRAQLTPRLSEVTTRTPSFDFPVRVRVLLPDGYSAKRRYPVLYLLHGSLDNSA